MASVTVDDSARTDPRFKILAAEAGFADARHALGAMLEVWSYCTERGLDTLEPRVLGLLLELDPGTAKQAVVAAELGELRRGGKGGWGIRIRGCTGRIEWREIQRRKKVAAAKARWNKELPDADAMRMQSTRNADAMLNQQDQQDLLNPPSGGNPPLPPPGGKSGSGPPPEALAVADCFAELVATHGANGDPREKPTWPTTRTTWATHLDRLHRLDGQPWERIRDVAEWIQPSWYGKNVRRPDKFRKAFEYCCEVVRDEKARAQRRPPPNGAKSKSKTYSAEELAAMAEGMGDHGDALADDEETDR